MSTISKEQLQTLADFSDINCVSIYIPTHSYGKEVNEGQDTILLKNHYQRIRNHLKEKDIPENEANAYLSPIQELIDDHQFWHHQQQGLAVFLAKDFFQIYKLPYTVDEFSHLSTSFHLGQLVPMFGKGNFFYILGVSQKKIRLLEATEQEVRELDLQGLLPEGREDALSYYEFEKTLQSHSGTSPGGAGGAVFHGQGGEGNNDEAYLKEYFRQVDGILDKVMIRKDQPTVLAAVGFLHPIYKEANKSLNIYEKGIEGNPDELKPQELHQKAMNVLQDHLGQEKSRDQERYAALAGSGQASYDIKEIAPAAIDGRIDTLFFVNGTQKWGLVDLSDHSVELYDEPGENAQDLVSKSAVQTILHGGKAYAVDQESLPEKMGDATLAAIFRW